MGNIFADFSTFSQLLARDEWRMVDLKFDDAQREFERAWEAVLAEFGSRPQNSEVASAKLIDAQPVAAALVLAMARADGTQVFARFRRFVETILVSTERLSGYPAVRGVPHVQAGFLYMAASVMALHWESWDVFEKLLNVKFEWYYQSGRAIFSYPFDMPYFFHSEAFSRGAGKIHDFFRARLAAPDFVEVTRLSGEKALDAYNQAQMLMCLRVAQLYEAGEQVRIWPDYGRFYSHRVVRLLDRAYADPEFGAGMVRAFGEGKEMFFARLNDRLQIVRSVFFKGSPYLYESIASWEPREAHA
jgi:hypothetical protein